MALLVEVEEVGEEGGFPLLRLVNNNGVNEVQVTNGDATKVPVWFFFRGFVWFLFQLC